MAATCMACTACCSLCCCGLQHVFGCGPSIKDLVEKPPSTVRVSEFLESLRGRTNPDGESDVCCLCVPKGLVCCCPRLFCPCICRKPDPVATIPTDAIVTATKSMHDGSFLADQQLVRYATNMFQSKDGRSSCRWEYWTAGLVLLSVGNIQDKLKALFDNFQHILGVFDKGALQHVLHSILKTVTDLAERLVDTIAKFPGGKALQAMLTALQGTIGSYFVENKVDRMLHMYDGDASGTIEYNEFERLALRRDSLVRKSIAWTDHKTARMRGDEADELRGALTIQGQAVYARIHLEAMDAQQSLEYWATEAEIGGRNRLGQISLREPCVMMEQDDNDGDNTFVILDCQKNRWTIECRDPDKFFAWYDAVDDQCDAKLQDNDLIHDGPLNMCPLVPKMMR